MTDNSDKASQLLEKLEMLLKRQEEFSKEISDLQIEINKFKTAETGQAIGHLQVKPESPVSATVPATEKDVVEIVPPTRKPWKVRSDLEKFIGENLVSKVGIVITVIGVAIGAQYAIDNQLISPLTRIVLGYLFGVALLGVAIKLKKQYGSFSAVLLSGSMTIMYFMTYFAYDFYGLIPQPLAFVLMVIFTAFSVLAALHYDKQVIAHIGLVGAYAVPFFLSDGSGKAGVLFTYMAIINAGILATTFKKYWKSLYYASFGITWLIYFSWYASVYHTIEHFGLALTFLTIFFALFYLAFLAYKLLRNEKFERQDIILLLANSFVFYGLGYAILESHEIGRQLLGIFTLMNAIVHFGVAATIHRQQLADRNLFYMVAGLVLVFITVAIPVQLDGNWVTLLWAGEAALLFWIGRTKKLAVYEKLSYPLMLLAFFSLWHDWTTANDGYNYIKQETWITPVFNVNFLSALLFIAAFLFINVLNQNKRYSKPLIARKGVSKFVSLSIPAILLITAYCTFRIEIELYWNQLYAGSILPASATDEAYNQYGNYDLKLFKAIWIINYSLLFFAALAFFNLKKIQNQQLGLINIGLILLSLAVFLTQGLYSLSELRESYLEQTLSQYYEIGVFNIGIRYVSFAFVAMALMACYQHTRQGFMQRNFKLPFDFLLHVSVLWITSSELIHWMDMASSTQSYKLGLSILWGVYALFLIALGIQKKKKHLRIGAITLFGITLLKLFFYDISHLDALSKTAVLVVLGVLLLIISFLYNKYKHIIFDEVEH